MNHARIIENLDINSNVFASILTNTSKDAYLWKSEPGRWCLLEIVCHLFDEEREDFRGRVKHILKTPEQPLPMFDPLQWVKERNYMDQDFDKMVRKFLKERKSSIKWLKSLQKPPWENAYEHPKLGGLTAEHFLVNWLAHDYLHIRQIQKVQYQYLSFITGNDLSYAGNL